MADEKVAFRNHPLPAKDDGAIARAAFRAGLEMEEGRMRMPLHECVERLHATGYVVLGPENAEETAQLLGMIAFPFWEQIPALEEESVRDRAAAVLAAFPPSFGTNSQVSSPERDS